MAVAQEQAVRYPPPPWESGRWPHPNKWEWRHWEWWLRGGGWPAERIALYRQLRDYWGVATRPLDKRGRPDEKAGLTWHYRPTPLGVLFHQATQPYVLFGGARGGAKSHTMRWDAYRRCLTVPNYRAILFRRMHEELILTHVDRARTEVPAITGGKGRIVSDSDIWFPNGSLLKMGHCKDVGDEEKYLGSEWDLIDIDQAEMFAKKQLVDIMGSGRTSKEGVQSLVRMSANPGGMDPQWLMDHFRIQGNEVPAEDAQYEGYNPEEWLYISARVWDNPWLMDPDGTFRRYEGRLRQYDPVRRRQMLEGDWSARAGQFFAEFSQARHVARREPPKDTRWYLGLDYGFNNPGCVVWVAVEPDGHALVRYEYKFTQTNLDVVAREIGRINRDVLGGVRPVQCVVDPDLDAKKGGETGVETLRRYRVPAVPGDNNRHLGWLRIRHWLADAPDGRPWLQLHPDCRYLIRSLPTLISDDHDAEDVDTQGDDHGADALRYVLMARPAPVRGQGEARTKFERGTVGYDIQREKRRQQRKRGRAA